MRRLLGTDYGYAAPASTAEETSSQSTELTQSWLSADFDDEEEDMSELDRYFTEKMQTRIPISLCGGR
jgi:hypothetical protein